MAQDETLYARPGLHLLQVRSSDWRIKRVTGTRKTRPLGSASPRQAPAILSPRYAGASWRFKNALISIARHEIRMGFADGAESGVSH